MLVLVELDGMSLRVVYRRLSVVVSVFDEAKAWFDGLPFSEKLSENKQINDRLRALGVTSLCAVLCLCCLGRRRSRNTPGAGPLGGGIV